MFKISMNRCSGAGEAWQAVRALIAGAWVLSALAACATESDSASFMPPTTGLAAPDTQITAGPTTTTRAREARFELSSTVPDAVFRCRLDAAAATTCTSPVALVVTEGTHTFEAWSVTPASVVDTTPARWTWTVDASPVVALTAFPGAFDNTVMPRFEFTSEPGAIVHCALDSGALAPCSSPYLVATALGAGRHTFSIEATDATGHRVRLPDHVWVIDLSIADTRIDAGPAGYTSAQDAVFALSSPDAGDGARFECALDTSVFTPCSSPQHYALLSNGPHQFLARVVEPSGNIDPTPAARDWTVDRAAPLIQLLRVPGWHSSDRTPLFEFSVSDLRLATVECRLVSGSSVGTFAACSSPYTAPVLADGPAVLEIRAQDDAGNEATEAYAFEVDTVDPLLQITGSPGALSSDRTPTFAFSAPEPVIVECLVSGRTYSPCTSPFTVELFDGSYTMTITATDLAGNATSTTQTFVIDTQAPPLELTSAPTWVTTPTPRFSFVTEATAVSTCQLDSGAFVPCTSPHTVQLTAGGQYKLTILSTDLAGNTAERSRWFFADLRPLGVTITGGPDGDTNDDTPDFTWTDQGNSSIGCRYDGEVLAPCAQVLLVHLSDGPHTFEITVENDLGQTMSASRSFTVDTVPPDVTIVGGPPGTVTTPSLVFTFITDGAPVVSECRVFRVGDSAATYVPCVSPHPVELPSSPTPATYVFEVRVRDAAGNHWSDYRNVTFAP